MPVPHIDTKKEITIDNTETVTVNAELVKAGCLYVESNIYRAKIYLNNKVIGVTKIGRKKFNQLAIGNYSYKVDSSKYGPIAGDLTIEFKKCAYIKANFDVLSGFLSISSNPSGATVYIDKIKRGKTPINSLLVNEGRRFISLKHKGHHIYNSEVLIKANETTSYSAFMKKLPMLQVTQDSISSEDDANTFIAGTLKPDNTNQKPTKKRKIKKGKSTKWFYKPWVWAIVAVSVGSTTGVATYMLLKEDKKNQKFDLDVSW